MLFHATIGQAIAVTAGIVLTKGGSNSALAVGGGRESKPWLIKSAHPPLPFDTLVTGMGQGGRGGGGGVKKLVENIGEDLTI